MTSDMAKDFTVKEAAEYLGVHIDTIRRMAKAGQIPFYRIGTGNHRRFKKTDLDKIKNGKP